MRVALLANRRGWIFAADGDLEPLVGRPPQEVCPGWIHDIVDEAHRDFVAKLLQDAAGNAEGRASEVLLRHPADGPVPCHLTVRPAGAERWWLELVPTGRSPASGSPGIIWVDFFDSVAYLTDAAPDRPIEMMLVEVGALREASGGRMRAEAREALRRDVEETLAGRAVDRQVSRLDQASYGYLTEEDDAQQATMAALAARAEEHGLDARAFGLQSQRVGLEREGLDPAALRCRLGHLRHRFLGDIRDGTPVRPVASLAIAAAEIDLSQRQIREALDAGRIALTVLPVADLTSGDAVLHLGYGNIVVDGAEVAASRLLVLSDYPHLAAYHDLAIARLFCDSARTARAAAAPIDPIVIDVEAVCLAQAGFRAAIASAASEAGLARGALGFRLLSLQQPSHEGAESAFLRAVLSEGHPVWLTRFTAALGGVDLKGGYVEVTSGYLRRLCEAPDGRDLVVRLSSIWRRAKVEIVAAALQSADDIAFVRSLGIRLGIGPAVARF